LQQISSKRLKKNPEFILPLLKAWREIDYRKVRRVLQKVINDLMPAGGFIS